MSQGDICWRKKYKIAEHMSASNARAPHPLMSSWIFTAKPLCSKGAIKLTLFPATFLHSERINFCFYWSIGVIYIYIYISIYIYKYIYIFTQAYWPYCTRKETRSGVSFFDISTCAPNWTWSADIKTSEITVRAALMR